MSLIEELEKLKAEFAERQQADNEEEQETETEQPEPLTEIEEEKQEEDKQSKNADEEEKIKDEEDKKELDSISYLKLRREAAAERKRADELQRQLEESRNRPKEETTESQDEELAPQVPEELQELLIDHRMGRAEKEFMAFESKVKNQYKQEYDAVTSEYAAAMYNSVRLQNPKRSDQELGEMTKRAILMRAAEFAKAGYENPVEEMFHEAKSLGYTGKSFQTETKPEPKEEKLQPDMRKLAENRKRSTGMTTNNGRSEGLMTMHAATDLTAAEWAKLPNAEKKRLMYGA